MAHRDEIIAFADDLLDSGSFPDYGPMGMQVVGADDVTKVVCAVSSSRELFERAAAAGAELVLVHHGLFWDNEPRVVDVRMKERLRVLFDADITLAAYHLALDAHPEIGNNILLARELGLTVEAPFGALGVGGRFAEPQRIARALGAGRPRGRQGAARLCRRSGACRAGRARHRRGRAIPHRGGREGYDALITGEAAEPTMMTARELGIHFVAAGHYATERLGVQALAQRIAQRFGLPWEFVELENPV